MIKYLLPIFLLLGCATLNRAPGIYTDFVEFKACLSAYLMDKERYLGDDTAYYPIVVSFGETQFPEVGLCYRTSDQHETRDIIINKGYWYRASEELQCELLMHELGHCDLNYEHQEKKPGIMNAELRRKNFNEEAIKNFFLEGL